LSFEKSSQELDCHRSLKHQVEAENLPLNRTPIDLVAVYLAQVIHN
jgi:hypothetical protein